MLPATPPRQSAQEPAAHAAEEAPAALLLGQVALWRIRLLRLGPARWVRVGRAALGSVALRWSIVRVGRHDATRRDGPTSRSRSRWWCRCGLLEVLRLQVWRLPGVAGVRLP